MTKHGTINSHATVTIRIWSDTLPELLDLVKTYITKDETPNAYWSVTINPQDGITCDIWFPWMAILTYYSAGENID